MAKNMDDLKEELRGALLSAKDTLLAFQTAITDKNAVIFLGNSRSGKSTLINYITGTRLISFQARRNFYKIEKVDDSDDGPHIGQGSLSDTTVPGIYRTSNSADTVAIDAPGFCDNRGEIQDIVNAIFVNQISFARTCKFVLVTDVIDITSDNIGGFLNLIAKVNSLIPDFQDLYNCVSLVVTKDNNGHTQGEIAALLREKVVEVDGLNIDSESRKLINCFMQQNELIGLLRMPEEEGEILKNLDVNIEGAIACASFLHMNQVSAEFAISEEAELILLKICQELCDDLLFDDELNRLMTPYDSFFNVDEYIFASLDEELRDTKQALNSIKEKVDLAQKQSLSNVIAIKNSFVELVPLDEFGDFYKTLMLVGTLNEIGLIQQTFASTLVRKYKASLLTLMSKITSCIKQIDEEKEKREELNLGFNATLSITGISMGAAAVGAALMRTLTMRALVTGAVGISTGIGIGVTVVAAAAALGAYLIKKEEIEKRIQVRAKQGRPLPVKDSQSSNKH